MLIYEPKGQAREYSSLAMNLYRGCGHKCAYCYVPNVIRMDRTQFNTSATLRSCVNKSSITSASKKFSGDARQVMMSFTTDPYHPFDTTATRQAIEIMRDNNVKFSTLTKGGLRSVRDIDLFRSSHDAFASTLTSVDDAFSKKWEPGAALPGDRIEALKRFSASGIYTWVSIEPTIDTDATLKIIEKTKSFVNFYKIGRVNYMKMTKQVDWESYTLKVIEYLAKHKVSHYIKNDLQRYLPERYENKNLTTHHF